MPGSHTIHSESEELSHLREIIRVTVALCAAYGFASSLAPAVSKLPLPIHVQAYVFRACDFYPAIALFLAGMTLTQKRPHLRLVSVVALPLVWIYASQSRGPWLIPGTFDWSNRGSFQNVLSVMLAAVVIGALVQLIAQGRISFGKVLTPFWVPYLLIVASIAFVLIGETMTPLASVVPLTLHLYLSATAVIAGILDMLSPSLVGD